MANPDPAYASRSRAASVSNSFVTTSYSFSWIKVAFCTWKRSKNPDLTEESLEEFNRRNAAAGAMRHCSPYYKGLTYSGLHLSRLQNAAGVSPERETRATAVSTGSSVPTTLIKLRQYGYSCFGKRQRVLKANAKVASPPPSIGEVNSRVSVSTLLMLSDEMGSGIDEMKFRNQKILIENRSVEQRSRLDRKPLREIFAGSSGIGVRKDLQEMPKEPPTVVMKEKEFVWADKYRPKALKDFTCNRDKAELLRIMVANGECNHFIFEGLPGVGKRTMISAFLREAFGLEQLETREELKKFKLKEEMVTSIEVNIKISSRHVEINLSELRGYEKHVILALIEEKHGKGKECDLNNCQAIILYKADRLSADSQYYIRWMMERHKGCSKIIFCCSDVSKLHPISSVCTLIQLLPPSNDEVIKVLNYIAVQEGIELPHHLAERIMENSKQNLRQAIRSFEASWQSNYPFKEDQVIMTGWEEDIANIARNIINEQSPKQLYVIRGKLQILIEHNISPEFIFSMLVSELKKRLDDQFQSKVDTLYLEYNSNSASAVDDESLVISHRELLGKNIIEADRKNVDDFMRIEEFTAKFMSFYKAKLRGATGL